MNVLSLLNILKLPALWPWLLVILAFLISVIVALLTKLDFKKWGAVFARYLLLLVVGIGFLLKSFTIFFLMFNFGSGHWINIVFALIFLLIGLGGVFAFFKKSCIYWRNVIVAYAVFSISTWLWMFFQGVVAAMLFFNIMDVLVSIVLILFLYGPYHRKICH